MNFFLSYSNNDSVKANELYTYLTNKGYSIWYDKNLNLSIGSDWRKEIKGHIDACDCFLFLSSQNSNTLDSGAQNELKHAIIKKKAIIPIRIDNTKNINKKVRKKIGVNVFSFSAKELDHLNDELRKETKKNDDTKRYNDHHINKIAALGILAMILTLLTFLIKNSVPVFFNNILQIGCILYITILLPYFYYLYRTHLKSITIAYIIVCSNYRIIRFFCFFCPFLLILWLNLLSRNIILFIKGIPLYLELIVILFLIKSGFIIIHGNFSRRLKEIFQTVLNPGLKTQNQLCSDYITHIEQIKYIENAKCNILIIYMSEIVLCLFLNWLIKVT